MRTVAGKSLIGTFVVQSGRFKFVNQQFQASTGYGSEELLGRDCLFLVHEDDRAGVREHARAMLKGFETRPYEYRIIARNGDTRWILETVASISFFGEPASLGSFMDVTERKSVEEDLKANLSLHAAILESTADGILAVDNSGRIVSYNRRFLEMWNIPDDVIESKDDNQALTFVLDQLSEPEAFIEKVRELYATPDAESLDALEFKDGRVFERRSLPQKIDGITVGRVWSFRDVTESRQESRRRELLGTVVETTTDLVSIFSPRDGSLYLNPSMRKLLGLAEDSAVSAEEYLSHMPASASRRLLEVALPGARRSGSWSGELAYCASGRGEVPVSLVVIGHRSGAEDVEYFSAIGRDISERKLLEQRLTELAERDPLTSLFNRRSFQQELDVRLTATRFGAGGALLVLDVDQFKDINDSLGHSAGDSVLISLSAFLREFCREQVVARLGGDEFAIILDGADEFTGVSWAERLLEAISSRPIQIEDQDVRITASVGVALFPKHGETGGEVFARADQALYEAKEEGRNRAALYISSKQRTLEMQSRIQWRRRIKEALENDQFRLYAQEICRARTGETVGFELLLRMVQPRGEATPAESFIKVAERFGLIQAIDRWVIVEAIRLLAATEDSHPRWTLAVNVSGKAFDDRELLPLIRRELVHTGLNPSRLVIEVTESAAISNIGKAKRFVAALKELGCRFALDDFGAGFSSFYHLKHLGVDYLKIDGGFIRGLRHDKVNAHIVRAMVNLARGLGIETVAEYVADAETLELVRDLGVDCAQGFHISKPQPLSESFLRSAA